MDFTASIGREGGKYKGGEEREIMINSKDKIINNKEKDCQNWKIEDEKYIENSNNWEDEEKKWTYIRGRLQQTMWSQIKAQERQHRK